MAQSLSCNKGIIKLQVWFFRTHHSHMHNQVWAPNRIKSHVWAPNGKKNIQQAIKRVVAFSPRGNIQLTRHCKPSTNIMNQLSVLLFLSVAMLCSASTLRVKREDDGRCQIIDDSKKSNHQQSCAD